MAVRFSADGQEYTRTLSLGSQTQWTVCCWVKITTDRNAFSSVWSLDASTSDLYILQTGTDGTTLGVYSDVDSSNPIGGITRALTVGTWYFVGVTVNGTNGTMITRALGDTSFTSASWTSGSSPAPAASTTITNLRIGDDVFGGDWWNGNVAAFKLWTGASLTADEMAAEAWTYLPHRTANIRSWHPLTRAETTDYSGNALTLSGGTGATTEDGPGISWRRGRRRMSTPRGQDAETTTTPIHAPWTLPAPDVSVGVTVDTTPIHAPWALPTPEVSTTGSPPTLVQPGAIHAPWTIPTPAISVDVTVRPAPIIAVWSLPGASVTVPINPGDDLDGPGQMSLAGFRLGGGTVYGLDTLAGADIDMPPIDNGNVNNPSSDGAQSGRKLAQPRIITAAFKVKSVRALMREAMEEFRDNTPLPDSDEEYDLAIQILDRIYVTRGAVINRSAPINKEYRLGFAKVVFQFVCSDPRLYSRELGNATVPDGGTVEVFNVGNRKTRPLIRVPGPANTPHLEVFRTLADGSEDLRVIEFNTIIPDGELLTVDVARGTAELADGTSLTRHLVGSVALTSFVLGRGTSEISYETADEDAPPAVALWRHAWL